MILWLTPPKKLEVAKYIECYWFLEKSPNADGTNHPQLNPDPSAHLIIVPDNQTYHYKMNDDISRGTGSHWLYPHCKTVELDHSKPFCCIGIKFHAGALYSLAPSTSRAQHHNQNNAGFTRRTLDTIEEINFVGIQSLAPFDEKELISIAKMAPNRCCKLLDELFMPWLLASFEDNHSETTRRILPLLSNTPISELGNALHCSQRTLERSFLRVTGLTLKQCQSMNKLEAILEFLYQRKQSDIDWVDIAYQFGFSDQPHLIRYLKKHLNLTPKGYAQKRGFTIDVYGGVDAAAVK
jgi:AraC-like DNA-binding protein